MIVSIAVEKKAPNSPIPEHFEDARYLLLIDMDTNNCIRIIDGTDAPRPEMLFAQETIDADCEAIVCGDMAEEPFELLASHQITRFDGHEYDARMIKLVMDANLLPLIRDFRGGEGCPSHGLTDGLGECHGHDHGEDEE